MWKDADSSKGPRKDLYSAQAINKALKKAGHTSLAEQFANYSAATRATHLTFTEGAALNYPVKSLGGQASTQRREEEDVQDQARPPDQRDVPVRAGRRDHQAQADAEDGPEAAGSRAVVAIYGVSGTLRSRPSRSTRKGIGNTKVPFDATSLAVEVTLVNASTLQGLLPAPHAPTPARASRSTTT